MQMQKNETDQKYNRLLTYESIKNWYFINLKYFYLNMLQQNKKFKKLELIK